MHLRHVVTTHAPIKSAGHLLELIETNKHGSLTWHFHANTLFVSHPIHQAYKSGGNKKESNADPTMGRSGRGSKRSQNTRKRTRDTADTTATTDAESVERKKKRARAAIDPRLTGTDKQLFKLMEHLSYIVLADLIKSQTVQASLRFIADRIVRRDLNAAASADSARSQNTEAMDVDVDVGETDADDRTQFPPKVAAWILATPASDLDIVTVLRYLGESAAIAADYQREEDDGDSVWEFKQKIRLHAQRDHAHKAVASGARSGNLTLVELGLREHGLPDKARRVRRLLLNATVYHHNAILARLMAHGDAPKSDLKEAKYHTDWLASLRTGIKKTKISNRALNFDWPTLGPALLFSAMHAENWRAMELLLGWQKNGTDTIGPRYVDPRRPLYPEVRQLVFSRFAQMPLPAPDNSSHYHDLVSWLLVDKHLPGLKQVLEWTGLHDDAYVDVNTPDYLLQACKMHVRYNMSSGVITYLLDDYQRKLGIPGEVRPYEATDEMAPLNAPPPSTETRSTLSQSYWTHTYNEMSATEQKNLAALLKLVPGYNMFTIFVDPTRNQRDLLRALVLAQNPQPLVALLNWRRRGGLMESDYVDPRLNRHEPFKMAVQLGRYAALVVLAEWTDPKTGLGVPLDFEDHVLWRLYDTNLAVKLETPKTYARIGALLSEKNFMTPETNAMRQNGPSLTEFLARRERLQKAAKAMRETSEDTTDADIEEIANEFGAKEVDFAEPIEVDWPDHVRKPSASDDDDDASYEER